MKQIIFFLFSVTIVMTACKDKKQTAANNEVEQKTTEVVTDPAKDTEEIRSVVTSFYIWYNKNFVKFQEYNLYSGIRQKDAPPYKINWEEVTRYQDFIRSAVPQLGEEFIANQKKMLQQCDSAFKVDVQDEIPYGFDYDWYTNSQEDPQYLVDEINKPGSMVITPAGDNATVNVKGEYDNNGKKETSIYVAIGMKKENGQWKIVKIGND